jgi:hypothetical protein
MIGRGGGIELLGALEVRRLMILRNGKQEKNAATAGSRYTLGTQNSFRKFTIEVEPCRSPRHHHVLVLSRLSPPPYVTAKNGFR